MNPRNNTTTFVAGRRRTKHITTSSSGSTPKTSKHVVTLTDESLNNLITPAQRAEIISLQNEYERLIRICQSASLFNNLVAAIPTELILVFLGNQHLTNTEIYQEVREKLSNDNPTFSPTELQFATLRKHSLYIAPTMIALIVSTKYFISDRIISKLYMRRNKVSISNLESFPASEANEQIETLKKLHAEQIPITNESISTHRVLLFASITFALFVLSAFSLSDNVLLMALGAFSVVGMSISSAIQPLQLQRDAQLAYDLTRVNNALTLATKQLGQENWALQDHHALGSNAFVLNIRRNAQPARRICQAIVYAFKEHGLSASIRQEGNKIIVNRYVELTTNIAKKINHDLFKLLGQLDEIEELKSQYQKISKKLGAYFTFHQTLKGSIPALNAYLFHDNIGDIKDKLKNIFQDDITFNKNTIVINRTTTAPQHLIDSLSTTTSVTALATTETTSTSSTYNPVLAKKQKPEKNPEIKSEVVPSIKPKTNKAIKTAEWENAEYDSSKADNNVIPFNTDTLPEDRIFVTSALKEDDFNVSTGKILFKLFQNQLLYPTIAAKKQDQGFVLNTSGQALTPQREKFDYDAKIKFLGKTAGDVRIYCTLEVNENGDALYTARGIKLSLIENRGQVPPRFSFYRYPDKTSWCSFSKLSNSSLSISNSTLAALNSREATPCLPSTSFNSCFACSYCA